MRLALSRVASENLRLVDLRGCHNISAGGMEDILQCMAETCSGVKEVDVTELWLSALEQFAEYTEL